MSEHEDGGEVGSSLDEGGGVKGVSEGERGGVSASLKKRLMSGPLAWMARNSVAANLAMLVFILGGFMMLGRVKQEVFPEFELDTVSVSIAYPGASPAEVEQGAVLAIEEAVRGLEGIKRVTSTASEGMASVNAELLTGADQDEVLNNVKSAVDRITSFPADSERPTISLLSRRRQVISLVVHGEQSETVLKQLADGIREDLLARPDITLVEVTGVRPPEISVEIPQEKLRRYNLTLEQVSGAIRRASVELPGGGVKTDRGEVLMRTTERRELGQEFDEIIVLSQPDGTSVKLGELADVRDTFQEVDQSLRFDGRPAALVTVYRIGDQTPIELSDAVREYLASREGTLPPGVELDIWDDNSEVYRDRINLLLRNAMQGLILVLLVLGLFLEVRLAFWVTLGIPISFLGAILFMPALDVSLNMISLFAFILTLGIVVDDAIVTGEAVYKHRMDGASPMEAAILGVKEVAMPVTFSVLTTVIAFSPLLFVPGVTGKLFRVIPSIVIPILLLSLFESLFVLPAHLGHSGSESTRGVMGSLARAQRRFARLLERGVERFYVPMARVVVRQRYMTAALAVGGLILTIGMMAGGRVQFNFFPKVEGDVVTANIELPFGSSPQDTERALAQVSRALEVAFERGGGRDTLSRGVLAELGAMGAGGGAGASGGHMANVRVFLMPAAERELTTAELTGYWREAVGELSGVRSLSFNFNTGPGSNTPIDVELSHPDMKVLEAASADLAEQLRGYNGLLDINDGFALGKEQLDFKLKPAARSLGLTETDLGRQVRDAFFGAEAARQQRGRDELRVFVRRPLEERQSEYAVETLLLRTPSGGEVPLAEAATIERGRSYTSITRQDGRRQVRVTADLDLTVTSADQVVASLKREALPGLIADHPGLTWDMGGDQRDRAESFGALGQGFLFALLAMFGLMAIPFRSYVQPIIVMSAIPFGIVGAVIGHIVMGYSLSVISVMGIVALSGVVVNDSLVLVDAVNTYRKEGMPLADAVIAGGVRRFRPILLTTLTTFFGLMPMILERSVQARFLIPMAISLGFGVLFVTGITLILVPIFYMMVEDVRLVTAKVVAFYRDVPMSEVTYASISHVKPVAHEGGEGGEKDEQESSVMETDGSLER